MNKWGIVYLIGLQVIFNIATTLAVLRLKERVEKFYPLTLDFGDTVSVSKKDGEPIDQVTVAGYSNIPRKRDET